MLILTRLEGQQIHIGDDIVITLVEIDRNKVRIGVDAPRATPVYRHEILPADHPKAAKQTS